MSNVEREHEQCRGEALPLFRAGRAGLRRRGEEGYMKERERCLSVRGILHERGALFHAKSGPGGRGGCDSAPMRPTGTAKAPTKTPIRVREKARVPPMKPPAGSINLDPPIWPTGPDLRHNAAHTK